MLVMLSPAKNMRHACREDIGLRKPLFRQQTEGLAAVLRQYNHYELESLMGINPKLALQAYCYYQEFDWEHKGLPALLTYDGLVFKQIQAENFTTEEYGYADEHVRILSAFYGMLRPCDGMQPYRLDMLCKMKVHGQTLYQYWGDRVYRQLFADGQPVLNLASEEYSKLVTPWLQPQDTMITAVFRTMHKGALRTITTSAKMARGQMTGWMVRNRVDAPEGLQQFQWDGYRYCKELSTAAQYVFIQE